MKKNSKSLLIKSVLAVSLLVFIVRQTDVDVLQEVLFHISWEWLGVAAGLLVLMAFVKSWQYKIFLPEVPYARVAETVIWQNLMSAFVASSAGVVSYMLLLKTEHQVRWRRSGGIFVLIKIIDLVVLGGYLTIASWFVYEEISKQWREATCIFLALLWVGVVVGSVGLIWHERLVGILKFVLNRLKIKHIEKLLKVVDALPDFVETVKQEKLIPRLFILSGLYMALSMGLVYAALHIFFIEINVWPVVYTTAWIQFASWLPIQIMGGLGVNEAISVYFYTSFGVPAPVISAAVLGWRGIFYALTAGTALLLPVLSRIGKSHRP